MQVGLPILFQGFQDMSVIVRWSIFAAVMISKGLKMIHIKNNVRNPLFILNLWKPLV